MPSMSRSPPPLPDLPGTMMTPEDTGAAWTGKETEDLVLVDCDGTDARPDGGHHNLDASGLPEAAEQPGRYSSARTIAAVGDIEPGKIWSRPGSLFLTDTGSPKERAAATRPQQKPKRRWSRQSPGSMLLLVANLARYSSSTTETGSDWRRDRSLVDRERRLCRIGAAFFGLIGTALAIAQDELIVRSHDPRSSEMNTLKAGNTLCTLMLLLFLWRNYHYLELSIRLKMHLVALHPLDVHVDFSTAFRMGRFWAEAIICGIHIFPFLTFELVQINWLNIVMYRAETLGALVNSVRIYLIWPVVRDSILETLPRRHTISAFTNVQMSSAFAFKVIMNDELLSLVFIAACWSLCFLLTGYWFRAAEFSACLLPTAESLQCNDRHARVWRLESDIAAEFEKSNDPYLWNAMWGMFTTSTTVGYGDILATTHAGRLVALMSAMTGMVGASSLTAALATALQWKEEERTANLVIDRQKARASMRHHAVRIIQNFMRERKEVRRGKVPTVLGKYQKLRSSWDARQAFRMAKGKTMMDLDECQSEQARFDNFFKHVRYIQEAVGEMEAKMVSNLKVDENKDETVMEAFTRAKSGSGNLKSLALVGKSESDIIQRAQSTLSRKWSRTAPTSKLIEDPPLDDKKYTSAASAHSEWMEKFGPNGNKVYLHIATGVTQASLFVRL